MNIMRLTHFSIIAIAILIGGCASIYEVGDDLSDQFRFEPVAAANTSADDLAPVSSEHGLYLTSNLTVDGDEFDRLYLLPRGASASTERLPLIVEGTSDRSGAPVLLADGSVVFAQCYRENSVGDCDLLGGMLSDDGRSITAVHIMPEPLNDIEWDQHPAVSGDGRLLVFASERFGGKGGSDLWWSTLRDGEWTAPFNMGQPINTSGNEITPFLSYTGDTLYFASDTHPGMGGFDLYCSTFGDGGWSTPRPLGRPLNSNADDIFYSTITGSDTSYLASNRDGGRGGFDIYRIAKPDTLPPTPPTHPQPPVKEKRLVLRIIAKNAYTLVSIPAMIQVTFGGEDLLLAEGAGKVEVPLQMGRVYSMTAAHAGYENAVESVRSGSEDDFYRIAVDEGEKLVLLHEIHLVPVAEEERKIYAFTVEFDFNLSNIRPEEERKLDSAALLLERFPHSTVVISGHTDSVGTVTYNIKLGYNRASEVSDYVNTWLRRKKITLRNSIEIRTYGESEPVAPNRTDEGRQRNRRVEIAIVRNR